MEALSQSLQPYKEFIGTVASVVTIGQFFAGTFICKDIHRKGSTEGISSNPFIGGIVIGALLIQYALMLNDSAMMIVNVASIVLNTIYLVFYYVYSCDRDQEVYKPLGVGSALTAVVLGYVNWEDSNLVEYRYSLILTVIMLSLMGSPLLEVKEIVRHRDASTIPFPIALMGSLVCFLWLLYSIVLRNEFMLVQNAVGMVLCIMQVMLVFIYPGGGDKVKTD